MRSLTGESGAQDEVGAVTNERPEVSFFPPILFLLALGAGVFLRLFTPLKIFHPAWIGLVAGGPLILVGLALAQWAERAMSRFGVRPGFKPVKFVVTTGPYAFTRNPIYLGTTLVYVGLALAVDTVWPILLLPFVLVLLHFGVITEEERYLEKLFGEEYQAYRARVRRWL